MATGDVHASNIIGAQVKNNAGQDVGRVDDLIVGTGGRISTAVIGVGGVLGLGDKKIGVPYNEISVGTDGKTVYVNMTEDELKARPAIEDRNASNAANRSSTERGAAAGATAGAAANRSTETDHSANERTASDRSTSSSAQSSTPRTGASSTSNDNGATRTLRASEQPASSLIGAEVVDAQNSTIGKIKDLIVSAGRQVMAVLSVGGVAGIGDRMVAVPLEDLTIQREADRAGNVDKKDEPERVRTNLTVSQLQSMPEFRYE